MDVVSVCPLRVASVTWRPDPGRHTLTVVCRGTFRLVEGRMTPAEVQLPVTRKDEGYPGASSTTLRSPTDLVPAKRGVDVLLVGHARAPGAVAVASFTTRLRVGLLDKRIEVCAERFFTPAGELVQAARTAKVPLTWDKAAGGQGTDNPVGMRTAARDARGRVPLPLLQIPGARALDPDEPLEPVGYGPLAPSWPPRRACLGARAADWNADRWWNRPLPEGFDFGYFNSAPADQRLEELCGDEEVVLENLLDSTATLRTRLPGYAPIGTLVRRRGKPEPLELRADTVWIDTDQEICTICWRAQVVLWHPSEQGRIEIDWAEGALPKPAASSVRSDAESHGGIDPRWLEMPIDDPDGGVTEPSYIPGDDEPFVAAVVAARPPSGEPGSAADELDEGREADTDAFDPDGTVPGGPAPVPPLPFQPAPAASPAPTASSRSRSAGVDVPPRPNAASATASRPALRHAGAPNGPAAPAEGPSGHLRVAASPRESTEVTRLPLGRNDASPLPFRSAPVPNGAPSPTPGPVVADDPLPFRKSVPPTAPGAGSLGGGPNGPAAPAPPPLVRAPAGPSVPIPPPRPSSPWAGPESGAGRATASRPRASSQGALSSPAEPNGEPPSPPPFIGPLATPEMLARAPSAAATSSPSHAADHDEATSAHSTAHRRAGDEAVEDAPASDRFEPGPGLRLLRLDACGRLAASLACRADDVDETLEAYGLRRTEWKANEAYWAEAIRQQTSRGRSTLLREYDAAYVDGLERERGPLTAEEYASLVVAAERGQGPRALRELGLPEGAMVRIERVFLRRVLESGTLGERIRQAIEAAREA